MLDLRRAGDARIDPSVAAPAVPMKLDLAVCARQIERLSGRRPSAGRQRSFYPNFFAQDDAQRILGKLRVH